jgi:alanyl-tRNA synthetase
MWEFFTQVAGLDPHRLVVTIFGGDEKLGIAKDDQALKLWQSLYSARGIKAEIGREIFVYGSEKNWWSRSGKPAEMPIGEIGGADSEIFYDFGAELKLHERSPWRDQPCHPNCDCGRYVEIGNSVFIEYQKTDEGKFVELAQKNVDYGGGLERLLMAKEQQADIFMTSLFQPLITAIEQATGKKYHDLTSAELRDWRILVDHIRSAVMLLADGVMPSNKQQGYVLRRLIRKSLLVGRRLQLPEEIWNNLAATVVEQYQQAYPELVAREEQIKTSFQAEVHKFGQLLTKGLAYINKLSGLDGKTAFFLYESYGFPWEITKEIAQAKGWQIDTADFEQARTQHRQQSRTASAGQFKGGLADRQAQTVQLHTATHLLLAALQRLIDPAIRQKGSNITGERARFDFTWQRALTTTELDQVTEQINAWIAADLPVCRSERGKDEALSLVGGSEFATRYPERVSIYTIGDASREICVGPHVERTGILPKVKLNKQQSAGAGVRRVYLYFLSTENSS